MSFVSEAGYHRRKAPDWWSTRPVSRSMSSVVPACALCGAMKRAARTAESAAAPAVRRVSERSGSFKTVPVAVDARRSDSEPRDRRRTDQAVARVSTEIRQTGDMLLRPAFRPASDSGRGPGPGNGSEIAIPARSGTVAGAGRKASGAHTDAR